uniref:Putative secreted protein n=1 Tax=Anopheles darlingi TaxID=43151 RepID=A0A2M4DB72_ANODA
MKGVVVTFAILFMPFILCSYVRSSEKRSQVGYAVFCVRWNIRNHEKAPLPPSLVCLFITTCMLNRTPRAQNVFTPIVL